MFNSPEENETFEIKASSNSLNMLKPILFAGAAVLATYLYFKVHHKRHKQFANFPQVRTNFFLGHLMAFGEILQKGPGDRHPGMRSNSLDQLACLVLTLPIDYIFEVMHQQLGKPPIMLVDMRPLNVPVALLTTHHLAEQVARSSKSMPLGAPKTGADHMHPLIGKTSLILVSGDAAKRLRKRYAPAFAPSHIMQLLPSMLNAMEVFVEHIEEFARTGNTFAFGDLTKLLTFDIIGSATMGVDLKALPRQGESQGEIVRSFLE